MILLLSLIATLSFADDTPEKYVTVTGTEYKLVPNVHPDLDPAYQDSTGLIWGSPFTIAYENGTRALVASVQQRAHVWCSETIINGRRARLPTVEEVLRLRESMSAVADSTAADAIARGDGTINPTFDGTKPALPMLDLFFPFWTYSISPRDDSYGFWFSGTNGEIGLKPSDAGGFASYGSFRCVIEALGTSQNK